MKEKQRRPAPARDLYSSTLFRGRRAYVERTCESWWILSAAHGLVHPDTVLGPYDVTLKDAARSVRREWSAGVLASIDEHVRLSPGTIVEIHAGADYRDFGLIDGLRARGCVIEIPTQGLRSGEQLRFYNEANRRRR